MAKLIFMMFFTYQKKAHDKYEKNSTTIYLD